MEDKQIIEFFYNRSEKAIPEMQEKYGQECAYIASHILQNVDEAEVCAKESLQVLWKTIPPHRPQNLKAYVCKITRNHALQKKYPDFMEQDVDLFSAELVIHDFLKGLEPEQRKLFIAHYWYFASVAEIALQYKMSEKKINTVLLSLRQKLDKALEEKQISFISEEELFFAMTEVEDRYLEEAAPIKIVHKETSEEIGQDTNQNTAILFSQIWKKYKIPAIACIVLLIFVVLIWSQKTTEKNPIEQNPTEESEELVDNITTLDPFEYIQVQAGDIMAVEDFDKQTENLPWGEENKITTLPIYKNLSYTGALGAPVYLDEDTLYAMAEDIATKLEMEIVGSRYESIVDETEVMIYGIVMTTDSGFIQIDGRGGVYVSFTDGVILPPGYSLSNEASKTNADRNVDFLISYYWDVFEIDDLRSDSYATYDLNGNRQMNYRAVENDLYDIESYYFNQVYFYFNEQGALTGFRYGDYRVATECLGFYPLISLEEAKTLLQEGKYDTVVWADFVYDEANIRRIELMYRTNKADEYYQPYYCFYVLLEDKETYGKFYVPAAQGVEIFEAPPEPKIKVIDLAEYEKSARGFVYYKDGQYYTVSDGRLEEGDRNELLAYPATGQVEVNHTSNGTITNFYFGNSEILNLDLLMAEKSYDDLGAMYIDGKVLIISIEYVGGGNASAMTTCYVYSKEDGSLIQTIESTPSRVNEWGNIGLTFYGDQYAMHADSTGELQIVNALEGTRCNTGIYYNDVSSIYSAGPQHFAIVYNTREIVIVEKASGQIVKKTKDKINGAINDVVYKDDMLYIETWNGHTLLFVISEFE